LILSYIYEMAYEEDLVKEYKVKLPDQQPHYTLVFSYEGNHLSMIEKKYLIGDQWTLTETISMSWDNSGKLSDCRISNLQQNQENRFIYTYEEGTHNLLNYLQSEYFLQQDYPLPYPMYFNNGILN